MRRRSGLATWVCLTFMLAAGCGGGATSRGTGGPPRAAPRTTTTSPTTTVNPATLVARAQLLPWQLPAPVYRTMAAVVGDKLYVLGGLDAAGATVAGVEEADPATETATSVGALTQPTHGATALTVGARVLVFGGASSFVYSQVQGFDPTTATTRVVGQLPGPRADVAGAVVGTEVFLLGGFDGSGPLQSVVASADGTTFHPAGQLALAVRYPAVAAVGGIVYLFGGLLSGAEYSGNFTTDIQRFDPVSGTSQVVAHLPVGLAHAMACVLDGQVLLIGGSTSSAPSAAIYRFDPADDTLSPIGSLPEPVTDGAVVTLGASAYLLGGLSTKPLAGVILISLASSQPSR